MHRSFLIFMTMAVWCCQSHAVPSDQQTLSMKWKKNSFNDSIGSSRMDLKKPFAKEPDLKGKKIFRGDLNLTIERKTKEIGCIWNQTDNILYVDTNMDGDLTNDPNVKSEGKAPLNPDRSYADIRFKPFQISIKRDTGVHRYFIATTIYSTPSYKNATFYIKSGYSGNVKLNNKKWALQVADDVSGKTNFRNFSIRSSEPNEKNSIDSLPCPEKLFLDGTCYTLDFEFKAADANKPALWCTIKEIQVPLAKLRIDANDLDRLVLGDGDLLILPRLSQKEFMAPVGEFRCQKVYLKNPINKYGLLLPENIEDIKVSIKKNQDNVLKLGTPFNNTVTVKRNGSMLVIDYALIGAGGEKYNANSIHNYDRNKGPMVKIYKGDMQLASGKFEFG